MSLILLIESSSRNCSVGIAENGQLLFSEELSMDQYVHAEKLHLFADEVMRKANKTWSQLTAVSVGRGPGSYTGLRIGISAAKGICFSLSIPLIAIDTLDLLALWAIEHHAGFDLYCPMIDARRMEVYTRTFNESGQSLDETRAVILDEIFYNKLKENKVLFIGDGAFKCAESGIKNQHIVSIEPSVRMMAKLSEQKFTQSHFENLAYFEPFYLKDFIPLTSKTKII
jgi:tRNA threonylcarbamoyladenosine biosynthesis protein TsaB